MSTDLAREEHLPTPAARARPLPAFDGDPLPLLVALVDWVRPDDPADVAAAIARLHELAEVLRLDERACTAVRDAIRGSVAVSAGVGLFAETGVLSSRGFVREIIDRLYERVLPAPPRPGVLRDVFERMFHARGDSQWVPAIPTEAWAELGAVVDAGVDPGQGVIGVLRGGMVGAIEVLAVRIAAEGSASELLHVDPAAARHDSPFLALQREVAGYLQRLAAGGGGREEAHVHVLLAQGLEAVDHLRSVGRRRGTSVRVTYLLERMEQQLRRLELLLHTSQSAGAERVRNRHELLRVLVHASEMRLSVAHVWRANTRILAKRVTENASRTGEHYATSTAAEYYEMMRSAMGAGAIIAIMALVKLEIREEHLPPLLDLLLVCADYSLGFLIIMLLHCTVATKQPAMTAATIAATVEETTHSSRAPLDKLARLIASVIRTQLVAIFGNIALALPLAMAIASVYGYAYGVPFLTEYKAGSMLRELRPVLGYALLHGAIAGVWLFAAGLVSGWYDNYSAVLDVPERVRASPLLRWMPAGARDRMATYLGGNLGGLMGNAIFGVLLAMTGFVGYLLGLEIDIRHVTFASANLGYAAVASGLEPAIFATYFVFVLMVGAVNLGVSFSLALNVAMRARGTTFARAPELLKEVATLFVHHPREFFLPPKEVDPGAPTRPERPARIADPGW
jgi:site-specific recombinase